MARSARTRAPPSLCSHRRRCSTPRSSMSALDAAHAATDRAACGDASATLMSTDIAASRKSAASPSPSPPATPARHSNAAGTRATAFPVACSSTAIWARATSARAARQRVAAATDAASAPAIECATTRATVATRPWPPVNRATTCRRAESRRVDSERAASRTPGNAAASGAAAPGPSPARSSSPITCGALEAISASGSCHGRHAMSTRRGEQVAPIGPARETAGPRDAPLGALAPRRRRRAAHTQRASTGARTTKPGGAPRPGSRVTAAS
mmetsp:Transcript_27430/g.94907  ORF Transcript_27430/g.94907 Transcript_27430/m.94907 type:complete len:270 (+) Transcript_27430:101-910(+)